MELHLVLLALVCLTPLVTSTQHHTGPRNNGEEKWEYVEVRPGAHMFWWLYYTTHSDDYTTRPLVIWLQGGPGGSSTGFGNFEILGPLDLNLEPRNTTWVQTANVLFVDNPVGTGYSYVENLNLLTTDVDQVAVDLMTMLKDFLEAVPEFKTIPIYIFGESYGGKMGAVFAQYLNNEIEAGTIDAQLVGMAMGNSWISPLDSTLTWGPFVFEMSTTDEVGLEAIQAEAQKAKDAADAGNWYESTQFWKSTEWVLWDHTNYVDFYNILKFEDFGKSGGDMKKFNPFLTPIQTDALEDLMNGEIREKLGIIPDDVLFGSQSGSVFLFQEGDFMKDVLGTLDDLLINTNIQVIVYQGQLDIICDTTGAMQWVQKLQWPGIPSYNVAERVPLEDPWSGQTDTFVKVFENFKFYWNLRAGHVVPADMGDAALRMLDRIIDNVDQ